MDTTLRFVAENSAPGSTIVFDYMSGRVVRGDHDDELLKQRLASWRGGVSPGCSGCRSERHAPSSKGAA